MSINIEAPDSDVWGSFVSSLLGTDHELDQAAVDVLSSRVLMAVNDECILALLQRRDGILIEVDFHIAGGPPPRPSDFATVEVDLGILIVMDSQ
jgi:hypothetical protein